MYFPIQTPFARRQGCQVSMATGELLLTLTDARLEGHLPFMWTRAYRSRAVAVDFGLGLGWAHPLQLQPGYRSHHASDGVLTALCDAYGNQVFISRDPSGRIQRLDNGAGHALHLRYEQDHIAAVDYQLQHGNAWSTRNTLVSYRYDALWRLIQATYATGETEHYRYNEQHLMIERRLGTSASLHWEWEFHHNTARCIRYRGEPGPLDTRYAWQSDGRVSVQGMDGSHEEYVHDRFARLVQRIDACGGEHFKSYDAQGRLAVEQAPSGEITAYQYDEAGRLIRLFPGDDEPVAYEYEADFVKRVRRGKSVWTYRRNAQGDITRKINPAGQVTDYHYNRQGKLVTIRHPDQRCHRLGWNTLGQLVYEQLPDGSMRYYKPDAGHAETGG